MLAAKFKDRKGAFCVVYRLPYAVRQKVTNERSNCDTILKMYLFDHLDFMTQSEGICHIGTI